MIFLKYIAAGQGVMALCCLFYAAWWYVAYNPKVNVNEFGGMAGILFWITFACGIAAIYLNIYGIRNLADVKQICLIGGAAYVILFAVTVFIFHRPLTAELFLIVAWANLETAAIFAAFQGNFPKILILIVTVATIFALISYLLYYNVDELKAFYLGMLPLILDAISAAVISISIISKLKKKFSEVIL